MKTCPYCDTEIKDSQELCDECEEFFDVEFSPEQLDTDCCGKCYSDADPGL